MACGGSFPTWLDEFLFQREVKNLTFHVIFWGLHTYLNILSQEFPKRFPHPTIPQSSPAPSVVLVAAAPLAAPSVSLAAGATPRLRA